MIQINDDYIVQIDASDYIEPVKVEGGVGHYSDLKKLNIIDQFLEWFYDCLLDLGEWFYDTLCRACSLLLDIIAGFIVIILIILLSPIWIPFLIFWLLFVRNKGGE